MRIAIVCPYSWSVPGGVANHVAALAGRLRQRGHTVLVLTPADGPTPPGVTGVGRSIPVRYNGAIARIAFGPRVAARIRRALRGFSPDLVHVHEPFSPSTGLLAAAFSPAPVVATFHVALATGRAYRMAAPALKPLWRRFALRIAVSEEARRTVERAMGPGVRIIPNGIELERFSSVGPAPDSPSILFVGRLERRKGAGVLLEALPWIVEQVPEAQVTIVGEGPERPALQSAAGSLPVRFVGSQDPEGLAARMEDAAIVCAPSLGGESFGIVLLEAMAAGRPVVAGAIPGYAAVLRGGEDGVLVPPGDAKALAGALIDLLNDPARRHAFATGGPERARRYSWDVVAAEIEDAYREALGGDR